MDEQAPPPYTAVGVDTAPRSHVRVLDESPSNLYSLGQSSEMSLRGGYIRRDEVASEPTHSSAVSYFEGRSYRAQRENPVLKYPIMIPLGGSSINIEYPQPEQDFRARDITDADWHTFTNFLLREEIKQGEKHVYGEPDTAQRESRIRAVINEWNEGFFNPRGVLMSYQRDTSHASSSRAARSEIPITFHRSGSQQPVSDDGLRAPNADPPPCYRGYSQGSTHRDEQYSQHRSPRSKHSFHSRRRSSSSLSSSSSSSSSSDSSVDSISSKDLNGLDNAQLQHALANFRATAQTTNLFSAVNGLRAELRSQRNVCKSAASRNTHIPAREQRDQRRQMHIQLKQEIRALKVARREQRRSWRQAKRAAKRERRNLKREVKRERRELKRENKAAYREAKAQRKAEKKAGRYAFVRGGVDGLTRGMQQMGTGSGDAKDHTYKAQETGVVGGSDRDLGGGRKG